MKEMLIVYQDCALCGANKNWGEKTIAHLTNAGMSWRKVSFASQEGAFHCAKAIEKGIVSFPFVTDGENYAKNVEDLLQKKQKKAKKTKKVKKGAKNGADSES